MSFAEEDFDLFYKELESDTEHLRKENIEVRELLEGRKKKGEEMTKKRKVLTGKTMKKVMPYEKNRLKNRWKECIKGNKCIETNRGQEGNTNDTIGQVDMIMEIEEGQDNLVNMDIEEEWESRIERDVRSGTNLKDNVVGTCS